MQYCKTCAWLGQAQNRASKCIRINTFVNPDKDYCSHYTKEFRKCDNCGRRIPSKVESYVVEKSLDSYMTLCGRCVQMWVNER